MNRRRFIALCSAVAGGGGGGLWTWLDYRRRTRLVSGPMVQRLATDGCTLVFEAHPAQKIPIIISSPGQTDRTIQATPVRDLRYEVEIRGIPAGQSFTYDIGPGLIRKTVRTAPPQPRPFRFVAFGDTGIGHGSQWEIARLVPALAPDLIVHVGDLVYPNGNIDDYLPNFYRPYAGLLSQIQFYPCLGNHDVMTLDGKAMLNTFAFPKNGPAGQQVGREYWFDYSGVRFVAFDSNRTYEQLHDFVAPWLDEVLKGATDLWKVVYWHEPYYTHGKYMENMRIRENMLDIIDRHHVNLVLCGHNHMYERTHPMRGGQIVAPGEGTVYVTTGAGGANLYEFRPRPPEYLAYWDASQHGFTVVDVTSESMRVRQLCEDRIYIDEFHVPRPSAGGTRTAMRDLSGACV